MKRFLRLSTLSGAIVASVMLAPISPLSLQTAEAQIRGLTIYGGGYGQGYGGYSGYGGGYGYSPYGRGAYTYYAPRGQVIQTYPTYRQGYGYRRSNYGMFGNRFDGPHYYGQPDRPMYNPYGYGGYGPYGY